MYVAGARRQVKVILCAPLLFVVTVDCHVPLSLSFFSSHSLSFVGLVFGLVPTAIV